MKKIAPILVAAIFLLFSGQTMAGEYLEIKTNQLKTLIDKKKEVFIVFPLSRIEFNDSHISGSFNIPFDEFEKKLPPNKEMFLVFYCLGEKCTGAWRAAEMAAKLGYKNVFAYKEGLPAWIAAGYPTISTEKLPNVNVESISTDQLQAELFDNSNVVLLDINMRIDTEKFHVDSPKRIHVPFEELHNKLSSLPKNKKIAVLCLKGVRSKTAARYLIGKGYKDVVSVDGGVEKWIAENKPVVRAAQKIASN